MGMPHFFLLGCVGLFMSAQGERHKVQKLVNYKMCGSSCAPNSAHLSFFLSYHFSLQLRIVQDLLEDPTWI